MKSLTAGLLPGLNFTEPCRAMTSNDTRKLSGSSQFQEGRATLPRDCPKNFLMILEPSQGVLNMKNMYVDDLIFSCS